MKDRREDEGNHLYRILENTAARPVCRTFQPHALWCIMSEAALRETLERERKARKVAEEMLEQKSRKLLLLNQQLSKSAKQLQKREAKIRAIVESVAEAIITTRTTGEITAGNQAAQQIIGHPLQKLVGMNIANILPDLFPATNTAKPAQQEMIRNQISQLAGTKMETICNDEGNFQIPVEVSIREIKDSSNNAYTWVIQDISKRKENEQYLKMLNERLMDASRQAGIAEIANSVLHNVGNVLNSVNTSSGIITTQLRHSKLSGLVKAVDLIREQGDDLPDFFARNPRGKQLPVYLEKLSALLAEEHSQIQQEVETLVKNINHIKKIVTSQQSYAGNTGIVEEVDPIALLEDAIQMNASSIDQYRINIKRTYLFKGRIYSDKHKLMQILVNILRNAKEALIEAKTQAPEIEIILEPSSDKRITFQIQDNGVGIPHENLMKIFTHGFTTKKNGHGFGLHSCALAAREMGGTLDVDSKGPGQGAMFTLQIPIHAKEK